MNSIPGGPVRDLRTVTLQRPLSPAHQWVPAARVVVGVAGSAAALRWAAGEACRREAVLRIVSAWEEPDRIQPAVAGRSDPAQIAAGRVQKALTRVLRQQHYPHHVACVTPRGKPGRALLDETEGAGLLVVGTTGIGSGRTPGAVALFCLRHAHVPVVFVPA